MIDLTAEQRQLAKIVHDYARRFPQTADGDAQLLQGCYELRLVALNGRSDAISNTLNRQPERPATKWLS